MTNQEKRRSINRLKSMYPLRAAVDGMYERGIETSKAGKPIAWCMVNWYVGDTILRVMDIAAVYPEDYGAVCAAFGAAPAYLERCEAEGFPNDLCGYARNCIGYAATMKDLGEIPPEAPMGGMPKPMLLLSSGYFCDARYKWFQALGRYLDAPVWVLEMPHPGVKESRIEGAYEHAIGFMVEELREFVAFLERLVGKKMDWDKLGEVLDDVIEMNRVWHEVNELRKARPCPMHSRDFWSSMPASLYLAGDPKETKVLYQNMYDELKDRIDNGIGAVPEEKYRLALSELPPWHSLGFFNQLADRGWNFVMESWNYHPPKPIDLSGVNDPLERLARYTYQHFTGYFQGAWEAGEDMGYFAYPYLEWSRDYQFDGLLLHPLLTCRTATTHLILLQDMLMKRLKIPSFIVEGDIVDLELFNPSDALNKAEAFEETMDYYKGLRKEEGLEW